MKADTLNLIPLFGEAHEANVSFESGPGENSWEETTFEKSKMGPSQGTDRRLVDEMNFPDQSMYILDEQLKNLKSSLNRLNYYLGELDDILPV